MSSQIPQALEEAPPYVFVSNEARAHQRVGKTNRSSEDSEISIPLSPTPHPRFARKAFISQWVPEVEPRHPRAQTFRTWHSRRDVVLWVCTGVSMAVFLVNLISTIVFARKYPPVNGIGTIFRGSRAQTDRLSSILHIVVNILSTLLLGASNMCMQLCVAPTRAELDHAHHENVWLDIGAPSIRNLKWISRGRQLLFVLLGLSSIPLHFLWNSAVFPSLVVNTYKWALVNPAFLDGGAWNLTLSTSQQGSLNHPVAASGLGSDDTDTIAALQNWAVTKSANLTHLDRLECLTRYTSPWGQRSNFLLVTDDEPVENNNTLYASGLESGYDLEEMGDWMCYWGFQSGTGVPIDSPERNCRKLAPEFFPGQTNAQRKEYRLQVIQGWQIYHHNVSYCLETKAPTQNLYTVEYSLSIMIVVCVANFCKFIGILLTSIRYKKYHDASLSILGDAIASFLHSPDLSTRGLGACSKDDIIRRERSWKIKRRGEDSKRNEALWIWKPEAPREWNRKNFRWYSGASPSRWQLSIGLCFSVIILASILLGLAFKTAQRYTSIAYAYSIGFGAPDASTLVEPLGVGADTTTLYRQIIFANSWQFIISFLYILINSLVTSLLVGNEWAHYAKQRKPLRVSAPEGIQRSSFFISMPYKYGAPLMGAIAVLHWTVSQSVFLIRIAAYYNTGLPNLEFVVQEDLGSSISAVGYSCSAITTSLVLGLTIVLGVTLLGLKKYTAGMPLASTCSAAISAACHAPDEDFDAQHLPVMWGVVAEDEQGHAYCSFTTAKDCRPIGAQLGWREWNSEEAQDESDIDLEDARKKKKSKIASLSSFWKANIAHPIGRMFHARFWRRAPHNDSESSASISSSSEAESALGEASKDEDAAKINMLIAPWPETEASRTYEEERKASMELQDVGRGNWLTIFNTKIRRLGGWFDWQSIKQKLSCRYDEEESEKEKDT